MILAFKIRKKLAWIAFDNSEEVTLQQRIEYIVVSTNSAMLELFYSSNGAEVAEKKQKLSSFGHSAHVAYWFDGVNQQKRSFEMKHPKIYI